MFSLRVLVASLSLTAALSASAEIPADARKQMLEEANLLMLPRARAIPEITLTDLQGEPYSTQGMRGHWSLLFFGFTFCPDVCPTTLSDMRRLFGILNAEEREQLRLVFVTADPARDTPDRLATYLHYFDEGFEGLTGDMENLQALSKAVGLPFVPPDTQEDGYSVTHSANMALIAPDGALRGIIRAPIDIEALQRWLPRVMGQEGQ
ncbi:SCO family protein [Pseudomonas sp. Marseille-QA0892]